MRMLGKHVRIRPILKVDFVPFTLVNLDPR